MNVLTEKEIDYTDRGTFNADYFEILFFRKGRGTLTLNHQVISIDDGTVVFVSPYQNRRWNIAPNDLQVTTLIFQEAFLNEFFADKLFTYKLLYFYQLHHPLKMNIDDVEMGKYCSLLTEIKTELVNSKSDSVHIIRSLLYYLLQTLNRRYSDEHSLSIKNTQHNFGFLFKNLMEIHIRDKQRITDYAEMLGISRISLNKAVKAQFNTTASQLLKQRLIFEIQNMLLYSNKTINEIAYELNFPEPNHLMRFFKAQSGQTTTEFINDHLQAARSFH